jgi:hypothetical protein
MREPVITMSWAAAEPEEPSWKQLEPFTPHRPPCVETFSVSARSESMREATAFVRSRSARSDSIVLCVSAPSIRELDRVWRLHVRAGPFSECRFKRVPGPFFFSLWVYELACSEWWCASLCDSRLRRLRQAPHELRWSRSMPQSVDLVYLVNVTR